MDATQQAHDFLKNARYADFFKLMQLNQITNPILAQLRMEFQQGRWEVHFHQRLESFFNSLEVILTIPLPIEKMSTTAHILSKFSLHMEAFVGREQDLQNLHASLQKTLPTVLVNGLGGIGKTTLAKEYIRRHLDKYAHMVWVEQTTSIIEAFVNDVVLLKNLNLTFQQETNEQRFELICNALQQIKGTNLLVLDNYQRPTDEETFDAIHQLAFPAHWRVLITSREKILDFETLELDILSEAEAMELFRLHAGKKVIDENELRDLLETVGRHTLMIELLAKNYRQNIQLKSIADFAGKIAERKIDDQVLQRLVRVAHSEREISMYKYLLKVFDLGKLDHKALHLLKQIAVLPTKPLPIALILVTKQEEQETYSEALEELAKKGWLSFIGEENVQMHRLVQMLILKITEPTYQDCEILCIIITKALDYDRVHTNPMLWQWASEYAEALLQNISFKDMLEIKKVLQGCLGTFYVVSGNYTKGLIVLEKNLQLAETIYGKEHLNYTTSLNNLAQIYVQIGLYDKALHLYEESLQIQAKTVGKQHQYYLTSLNNLGTLYIRIQKYEEAIALLQEVLATIAQTIGKQNEYYAKSLNNLASVYNSLQQYEESLPLYQESLQIYEQTVGKQHPDYADALHNLATWYVEQQLYAEALHLFEKALLIYENTLGKQHPEYANTLFSLGQVLIKLQQIEKGISYIIEVYQILLKGVGEAHPYTQDVGRFLMYLKEMIEKGEL